jgi:hypothetical protein
MLTKSDFKLACDCRRKLSYKSRGYPSRAKGKSALSEEGARVEALARALFPGGMWVEPGPGETAAAATRRMLGGSGDMVLFEATFEADGMSCRTDILERAGGRYLVHEVKSSAVDSDEDSGSPFRSSRGDIAAEWVEDLEDLAFQVLVLRRALGSTAAIEPRLVCVDSAASADALVHRWLLEFEPAAQGRQAHWVFRGSGDAVQASGLLRSLPAANEVDEMLRDGGEEGGVGVEARVDQLLASLASGALHHEPPPVRPDCKNCEYRWAASEADPRDGYSECWGPEAPGGHLCDLHRAGSLGARNRLGFEQLYQQGVRNLVDLPLEAINELRPGGKRQQMQVQAARTGQEHRAPELAAQLHELGWPLRFLDFETARLAVPAVPGQSPYDLLVFQYSCHQLDGADAALRHSGWIHAGGPGSVHLEFATRLRASLGDHGPILTWTSFERSALDEVRLRIRDEGGHDDLVAWIAAVTGSDGDEGRLVDLHRMCLESYIHPDMLGNTSIKMVLPAVLASDPGLRQHPWFADWFRSLSAGELDPYAHLPQVTCGGRQLEAVRDGLGAQHAYERIMQAVRKGDLAEAKAWQRLLHQYCELDTLAMVMVWWRWRSSS